MQAIPTINGAMFALLPPGGELGRHRDPFAGSLRYHLGLVTPNSDACKIFVDGEPYHWQRRRGRDVRRDVHPLGREQARRDAPHPVLRRRAAADAAASCTKINHWFEATAIRASQTENAPGDQIGVLNRIFSFAYYLRLPGKALKEKSRFAYYATKWVLVAVILYLFVR